jgi:peptide/nickel transport system permease protein
MFRALGYIFPGLPHLLAGRRIEGGAAMALWLWLLTVLLTRPSRVVGALGGGVDDWVAFLTLLSCLGGVWWWSFREVRRGLQGMGGNAGSSEGSFWERFKENRAALLGLAVVVVFYLAALLTPLLAPFDPGHQAAYQGGEVGLRNLFLSSQHLLGTDYLGRDVFSRILYGARISLSIGFLAVSISITIGALLGAVAGYLGGWVDWVVTRFADTVLAFPRIVLVMVLVALFQPSIFLIVAVLSLTQWPSATRIVRGEVLALREREFVEAARALGFSTPRIIFRHILPNAAPPLIVAASLGIGNTIVLEAGLSFLGLGVQPPTPSWGTMVADGRGYLLDAWWIATFPGLAIVMVVLAFNLVGDGLRDALDPRQGEARSP